MIGFILLPFIGLSIYAGSVTSNNDMPKNYSICTGLCTAFGFIFSAVFISDTSVSFALPIGIVLLLCGAVQVIYALLYKKSFISKLKLEKYYYVVPIIALVVIIIIFISGLSSSAPSKKNSNPGAEYGYNEAEYYSVYDYIKDRTY